MFRADHPLAWTFHRGTSRWPFNMHGLTPRPMKSPPFKENVEAVTVDLEAPTLPQATLDRRPAQTLKLPAL